MNNGHFLSFLDSLQAVLGLVDCLPIAYGTIQRFHVSGDKSGSLNGWYVLFIDRIATGCFGSWKTGVMHKWSSRKPVNHLEAQMIAQRFKQARRQREAELHQRQQAAAVEALRLWNAAAPASPDHLYLTRKGVKPCNLRQRGEVLLVPLYLGHQLVNLQRIHPDGGKRFLSGGMVKGCYSLLGLIVAGKPLYDCEGWATGATIHAETGAAVACAMNASNILHVGQRLKREHSDAVLIVAGDDDRQTEGNPGRTAATKAAIALGCGLVFPPWSGDEPLELSDFNDLHQWRKTSA
ncbi:DNA primase TraC [Pseudomonas fluorescens]|uniref:DNA primase TraC n=1 Tax=Pseudomonas fluorescens TaxID=294 RepID=A0A5E6MWH6_PSEFL|nr:DNA primase TraC [Pseudomonas fluorescens]VVN14892.1 DNA primase TraC [Pseudomonas fluorescens]